RARQHAARGDIGRRHDHRRQSRAGAGRCARIQSGRSRRWADPRVAPGARRRGRNTGGQLMFRVARLIAAKDLRIEMRSRVVTTLLAATCALALVGTLYGGLAAGVRGRETLLPLLLLPVVAPVLIGATRATEAALGTSGAVVSDGWPWLGLLGVFVALFSVGG